jgi:integrase
VFSTATGEPFSRGQMSRAMTKVRELASARGVSPDRTFHSSRHTFVSLAIQAKQDDGGCGTKSGTTARPTRGPPIRTCWSRPTI